jgi:hypothetical protein
MREMCVSYLSFIAGTVYKPPSDIQITESDESTEHVLFLLKYIVDVSLKTLGVNLWSNTCEDDKDGDDRRRTALSRGTFDMERARCRRSVVVGSLKDEVLGVK